MKNLKIKKNVTKFVSIKVLSYKMRKAHYSRNNFTNLRRKEFLVRTPNSPNVRSYGKFVN